MPLQVGKQWRSDANAQHRQSGIAYRASGVAKVVKQEQVTTPAGTFDTYQVETTTQTGEHAGPNQVLDANVRVLVRAGSQPRVKRKTEARYDGRLETPTSRS